MLVHWLGVFGNMRASDVLSEEQVRQLKYELDRAYNDFKQCMDSGN